ncbi:hypothetical protein CRT22_23955 [Escherichia sp. E5028]|uniref:hypothetical protein n=1 Tax=Escherichia sp. E5028 TaxID=2044602 RepID=UPI00107F7DDD|nr:hypothetical protein [Escherichia sp. E5028]TGB52864.1 hypothetical protein CRT22_23955 [Escherichia sp. E5028]
MLFALKSLIKTLTGCKLLKTVFEDIVRKKTKSFIFRVQELNDGSYLVIQQACRILPSGKAVVQYEKKWNYPDVKTLREGEFKNIRQGRMFLDDQFWIGKLS